jgi:hypothetical protein
MNMENLVQKLTEEIGEAVMTMNDNMQKLDTVTGKERITAFINVEHSIGKYHAHMDILSELDTETFTTEYELSHIVVEEAMKRMNRLYDDQDEMERKIQHYKQATKHIFSYAVEQQRKINDDPNHDTERIKAFRLALLALRPDLTAEQVYNEVERVSKLKWNGKQWVPCNAVKK